MNQKPYGLLSQPHARWPAFLSVLDHKSITMNLFSGEYSQAIKKIANQSSILKTLVKSQKKGWKSPWKWAGSSYSSDGFEMKDLVTVCQSDKGQQKC